MEFKKAYMVVDIDSIDNKWKVGGRAYEDVRIGDIVYANIKKEDRFVKSIYIIESITTYGKNTEILSKVMTGYVYLIGQENLHDLQGEYLYLENKS